MKVGDWYGLLDGQVVQVVDVSGEPPTVLAETPGGGVIDQPLENARLRWVPLPEDGLRVRLVREPKAIQTLASEDPVQIVVLILKDSGGSATTQEIRGAVATFVDPTEAARWWKRVQPRLSGDPRIDDSEALQKRYQLVAEGRRKRERYRTLRTGEMRAGRELLDGPTLKSARERAKRAAELEINVQDELMELALLAEDATFDSTDRFLVGEVAVLMGRWTDEDLGKRLGAAVAQLDLTRVSEHRSRSRAIELYESDSADPARLTAVPATLASAIAMGDPWAARALEITDAGAIERRAALAAGLAYGVPGSIEAGEVKHPNDLQVYLKRLRRMSTVFVGLDSKGSAEQVTILLAAMDALANVSTKDERWRSCLVALAEFMWDVPAEAATSVLGVLRGDGQARPSTWDAVVAAAPASSVEALEVPLAKAYRRSPAVLTAMTRYVGRRDWDLAAWLVRIARDVIREGPVQRMAMHALDSPSTDPVARGESATLAGTLLPDHPAITPRLERMETDARQTLLSDRDVWDGAVLMRFPAWRRTVHEVRSMLADAIRERDVATAARNELEQKIAQQTQLLEARRSALQDAKTDSAREGAASTQRLAVNLFKPVAAALDDSYEAGSLAALQDQLAAALARLRVRPIAQVGDVISFDPDRHTWTGEGYPPTLVRALTQGFIADMGDEDGLVVSFVRVGPADA